MTLCLLLVVVALLASFVSNTLVKRTIRDMQTLQEQINQQHNDLHRNLNAIEHHLGNARVTIHNILYKGAALSDSEISTRPLGELNKAIRGLENILPPETISGHRNELDNIASGFVALHYQALNWRVLHDLDTEDHGGQQMATVHDYLEGLKAANDTAIKQQKALQVQLLKTLVNNDNEKRSLLVQSNYIRNYINSSIRANLAETGRIIESLINSRNVKELTAIRDNLLLPAFESLREQIKDLPVTDGPAITTPQIDRLIQLVLGDEPSTGGSLYGKFADLLAMTEERHRINNELYLETETVNASLAGITEAIRKRKETLDTESSDLSAAMFDKLFIIQISTAGTFLLIVTFIITLVHKKASRLTRLKAEAQQASIAKNHLLQRMNDSETRYRTLFQTLFGALITIDDEGFIEHFNPAAERMFGYQPGEIIGRNIFCLVPVQLRRRFTAVMVRLKNSGQSFVMGKSMEITALRKDGSEFPITLAVSEMVLSERRLYSGIIMDISDKVESDALLIEARKRAEASDRAKSEFLASMSHEIRTPMNGILGISQLLLGSELDTQQKLFVSCISRAGETLLSIINDILDLSRIEASHLVLNRAPFDLCELVGDISRMFLETAAQKGVRLTYHYPSDVQDIWVGDEVRVRQILSNLTANAVKFTHHGEVSLKLSVEKQDQAGATLLFTIQDTGIGISEDMQKRIFESYVQAASTTTRQYGGSGLGLSICNRLVLLMNGEIGVNSTPGIGSVFWFRIQLSCGYPDPQAAALTTCNPDLPVLEGNILLVEDNEINQLVARHMLEQLHCKVTIANNGCDAITLLDSHDFDLILMDCHMPLMDGYQATRKIREHEKLHATGHIPIIALTANAMSYDRDRCQQAGMDDYLSKPLSMSELVSALRRQLPHACHDYDYDYDCTTVPHSNAITEPMRKRLNPVVLAELNQLSVSNTQLKSIIDTYLDESAVAMELLEDMLLQANSSELIRIVHRFKSSSAQIGAEILSDLCQQIYKAALDDKLEDASKLLPILELEYHALVPELRKLKQQMENTAIVEPMT